jgi:UDP-glucose:(heptosyl)LPS alpha-1,3-glucosyltransferase
MHLAFGIVSLAPKGGLQLDCLQLAHILRHRGHRVTIFTSNPSPQLEAQLEIVTLPVGSLTNHGRDLAFAERFNAAVRGRFERVVGFNKLLDLDLLYCADPSVHSKRRKWWLRAMPRHRVQLRLEAACFEPASQTRILALSETLADSYGRHWGTASDRFTILPPAIDPSRYRPHLRTPKHRDSARRALGLPLGRTVWLWVGTKPHTKGLDRVIAAVQRTPDVLLAVLGVEPDSAEGHRAWPQIQRSRVHDRVHFLGYRDDVPRIMAAADLLVHPARVDTTGQVILEAIVNGLPTITSEVCGYARYVREAGAGIVVLEPWMQCEFEAALREAMSPARLALFSQNGIDYGKDCLAKMGLQVAADAIEGKSSALATLQPDLESEGQRAQSRFFARSPTPSWSEKLASSA